jgi:cell division protein FtsL
MKTTALFKIIARIFFSALVVLLCGCIYTKSGNKNFNRDIERTALSGKAYIDISGHISEDIYAYNKKDKQNAATETPLVLQGQRTINKQLILSETEKFKYTLTTAEIVIMNIRSIDSNDVIITVFEYGGSKEYKIDGKNKLGQTILFKN